VSVRGGGRVTSDPAGIDCGANSTCSAPFATGVRITLTAESRAPFAHWGGACSRAGDVCDLTLRRDTSVQAVFAAGRPDTPPPPHPVNPIPTVRLRDQVDLELNKLRRGNIAFNAPTTLALGGSAQVQLVLSARDSIQELKKRITEIGEKRGATVKFSPKMEAHLTGINFKIQAITPELQAVGGQGTTEWRWEVEPTKTGTHPLHLTLSAYIRLSGEQTPYTIRTFETTMKIRVTWFDRVSDFVGGNWQWLWAVVVAPLAAAAWRLRKRSPQPAEPSPPPPPTPT
jgi:hypothetical protein